MRIVIFAHSDIYLPGGINEVVRKTSANLSEMGLDVKLIFPRKKNITDIDFGSVEIFTFDPPRFQEPFNLSRRVAKIVLDEIKQFEPDILHVHSHMNLLSHQIVRNVARVFSHLPIVLSPHFDVALSTSFLKPIFPVFNKTIGRKSGLLASGIVCGSEFESKSYFESTGLTMEKSKIIPLGIDWSPKSGNVKIDEELILIYCGHIIKRKRVDRIVRLYHKLKSELPGKSISLTIAGEGSEKKYITNLAKKLDVYEEISWEGFLDRKSMINKMEESHIFVLLSDSEAFGITVSEMLGLGKMALISDNTALSAYRSEPGVIIVENPDDFDTLVMMLENLFGKEIQVGPFSDRIRSWKSVTEEYFDFYRELSKT